MRADLRWIAGGLALAAALAGAPHADSRQHFRSTLDMVLLPVVVTGRDSLLVRGLKKEDFEVLEDGVRQTIDQFAEGAPGDSLPLHLGLLLDSSGSMEQDLDDAANAAVQFVTALEEAVDVTFLDFDTSIRIARFTRPNYPQLFERIRSREAGGGTALYDAIGVYVETAIERGGQHVLLLLTDGGEGMSRMNYAQLQQSLRFGNVIIYALGYLDNQRTSTRASQQQRLTVMARETGGEAYFPASPRQLQEVYARILDEVASRYTLGYQSTNKATDGKYRRVEVRLKNPAIDAARVRTRSGYLAPLRR